MCIVLDTNVLISGTFWSGASFRILQLIETGKAERILSKAILEEYDRILHSDDILEELAYQRERVAAVQKLLRMAIIVEPKERIAIVERDPDDDKFVEAAVAGNAEYLISKDLQLLKLQRYRETEILTPENFLALIET